MKIWLAAATAFAALFLAVETAQAATTVIGSGLAADCSKAAQRGRSDRGSVKTCDQALADEAMTVRDRAKTLINRGVMRMRRGGI